jgi:hypothetical protein
MKKIYQAGNPREDVRADGGKNLFIYIKCTYTAAPQKQRKQEEDGDARGGAQSISGTQSSRRGAHIGRERVLYCTR